MPLLKWESDYLVGIEEMDAQHKLLMDKVNAFIHAMEEGKGQQAMELALYDMLSYAKIHFNDEEDLMARNGYPELEHHKHLHHNLVLEVESFCQMFNMGDLKNEIDVSNFLKHWLIMHIEQEDINYANYINSHASAQ